MRNLNNELCKKSIDNSKLLKYGFKDKNGVFEYRKLICNEQFEMIVSFSKEENISRVIDLDSNEEYVLVDVLDATGEFVGKVRNEYENELESIFEKCTNACIFKSEQANEIIKYIKQKYNDNLEFLWEKFDDNAIWRNKQNEKWYGLLLTISESKLKDNSEKIVEIIDLRYDKEKIEEIVDGKLIFPGYHMNKKSWITIILDNSLDTKKIFELIDNSYNLSIGDKVSKKIDDLSQKVLDYLTLIPKGKVVTYKQVAEYIGNKGLARIVGNILHKNPDGDKYPCYKVLNSKGELAEAFVFGGKSVQKERLEKDGIEVTNNKVDLKKYQWK